MRSLVTGGAGFIGSHLVDALIQRGSEIVVVDDLSTGHLSNLDDAMSRSDVEFVQGSVQDRALVRDVMQGCDYVFHLAALADIVPSIEDPEAYFSANVDGTMSVLECARHSGVRKFVYAASSSCYGIPDVYPTPETADLRPGYPYALTKWMGEQLSIHWARVYSLPVVSLRLFNVYGPRSRTSGSYGAVMGTFLAQKLAGAPFTVVGTGDQTRDFTYVDDVVRAFSLAAERGNSAAIYNIGSGGTYSINRLVELLEGDVVYIPKRPGEPDCTFADTTLARTQLGWEPTVSFESGVQRVLAAIDLWRDAPIWDPESISVATREWFTALGRIDGE